MKSTKLFVGVFAALVLVAGGLYGMQQICAGENCAAQTTAKADKADAKVETASVTSTTSCCAAKASAINAQTANATSAGNCTAKASAINAEMANATSAGSCAAKAGTVNAEYTNAGGQCTYSAKTAGVQCTSSGMAKSDGELMTAEAAFARLAHCGIDCRTVDAQVLASKLAGSHCGTYTEGQWASMIKSAQALDVKQANVIFANATSDKSCAGDVCPMKKVAAELAAAQTEEKKSSTN